MLLKCLHYHYSVGVGGGSVVRCCFFFSVFNHFNIWLKLLDVIKAASKLIISVVCT